MTAEDLSDQSALDDTALVEAVTPLLAEHREVELELANPEVHSDQARATKLSRRYAELERIKAAYDAANTAAGDLSAATELLEVSEGEDADSMREMVEELTEQAAQTQESLRRVLAPRDPDDARNVIMEIKAGEGGEESALFAGDLLRMYMRFAERVGWTAEMLSQTETGLGGLKEASFAVKAKGNPAPEDGVWAHLKFEGGVHRVQRVPVTESQGRVHTSAAGVLVLPEVDDPGEIEIAANEIRIDVYRSSGPGGQSVNTTDSAVRITHIPTGIVVAMQDEKSQLQNREAAMRVLRARLLAAQNAEIEAAAAEHRHAQVRTVDRSERIRTYNFPENRVADHRTGYKAYNLDQVIDGDLRPLVQSAIEADDAARLAAAGFHQSSAS